MTDEMHDPGDIVGYRTLSESDIADMNGIKALIDDTLNHLRALQGDESYDQRCVALAITKAQEASMWGCRAIAQPTSG